MDAETRRRLKADWVALHKQNGAPWSGSDDELDRAFVLNDANGRPVISISERRWMSAELKTELMRVWAWSSSRWYGFLRYDVFASKEPTLRPYTLRNGYFHGSDSGATQVHLEAASTSSLAALAALQVLQWHAAAPRSMMGSSTSAASPASPTSLHGSIQHPIETDVQQLPAELRCGGFAAEL